MGYFGVPGALGRSGPDRAGAGQDRPGTPSEPHLNKALLSRYWAGLARPAQEAPGRDPQKGVKNGVFWDRPWPVPGRPIWGPQSFPPKMRHF